MRKLIMLMILSATVLFAQDYDVDRKTDKSDNDFITKAASGGMMEVELGKLAQEKGMSQEVKDFGARMERDHSIANDELKNIAQKNNITLPDEMLEEHQAHIDELSELSGSEFDEAYMELMLKDHEEDVELFEEASEEHEIQAIMDWAAKILPVLKEHKQLSEELEESTE